ncbi:phage putative head morphogenesis protein, SPP1 gp7 family [Desulfitobacterium dehalogenans ATCC 51507]|uniref:Phage putative head morphogenesis protein, SPP1 gp7 family n=1 Tax=Desulfitobacterium dehalogenans (strain ATCC 51507 / DSM 9161 / JW/IU-DC1) TaxID=756499 RepID=I4A6C7_DESDJ|nr:minor capsid protein [Desulfitobacterium dehalogenans]AFL99511.1 phage putative head morphogenesis protein, SPP1 gp7 family [Desulfitobacterium dehalogenans ATCC 51507]
MKTAEYWGKRSTQIAKRQFDKADEYSAALRKEYNRAILSIQKDMEVFYQRFADNNGIVDMAEARRLLNSKELKEFHWTLEEFTERAKNNADGKWTQQLDNAYFRTRVSRLEALQMQINHQVEMLAGSKQQGVRTLLDDAYTDTYYRTLFELQKGTGIGVSFAKVDERGLETILGTKLDGRNWSQRVWDDRTRLKQEIYTKLSQSFIRGDSLDKTTQDLVKRMDVSYSNAYRLIQTETAFFVEQATFKSYEESGVVSKFEILATLDSRTSDICQAMDGKVFKVSEQEVGINAPPFHVHCRTTTVPYFDDEEDVGERIARDPKTKKTYNVPGDMAYPEWYDKHVVEKYGKEQAELMKKQEVNLRSDQKQYTRYKELLGKDAPKTFDDFQELKYTETEKWAAMNRQFDTFEKIKNGPYSDEYKVKLKGTYRYFRQDGHELRIHALNRTVGQKQSKGKVQFTREDIMGMMKKPPNFIQEDGHLVRFENGIAIIQANDTNEILSIVTRSKAKANWKEV